MIQCTDPKILIRLEILGYGTHCLGDGIGLQIIARVENVKLDIQYQEMSYNGVFFPVK